MNLIFMQLPFTLSCMNSLVSRQVALGSKPFTANGTLKRTLLGVSPLMEHRLTPCRKYFGTETALDQGTRGHIGRHQLSMNIYLVWGKLRRLGKGLITLSTLVRLAVCILMVDQVGAELKGFLTDWTLVMVWSWRVVFFATGCCHGSVLWLDVAQKARPEWGLRV